MQAALSVKKKLTKVKKWGIMKFPMRNCAEKGAVFLSGNFSANLSRGKELC